LAVVLLAAVMARRNLAAPVASFSVTVLDQRGQSVNNARVSIVSSRTTLGLERLQLLDGSTGHDGVIEFSEVMCGRLSVQIEKPGFYDYEVSYHLNGEGGAQVRMTPAPDAEAPRGIEVTVVDAQGGAIGRAVVVASGERNGRTFNFQNESDERGRALFPFVSPGLVDLSIRRNGYAPYDRSHVVHEDDRLVLQLLD
jgi:hypothetical protein